LTAHRLIRILKFRKYQKDVGNQPHTYASRVAKRNAESGTIRGRLSGMRYPGATKSRNSGADSGRRLFHRLEKQVFAADRAWAEGISLALLTCATNLYDPRPDCLRRRIAWHVLRNMPDAVIPYLLCIFKSLSVLKTASQIQPLDFVAQGESLRWGRAERQEQYEKFSHGRFSPKSWVWIQSTFFIKTIW
jgi:hypothetical protein